MESINQQELLNKYRIINGDIFDLQSALYMLRCYQLTKEEEEILIQQMKDKIGDEGYDHIDYQDQDTIPIWIITNKLLVPKQLMKNINQKDFELRSLQQIMKQEQLPIPREFKDVNKMSIFDKAYFGIIPDITGHKSSDQDRDGFTVAMILAMNSINIPKQWEHDPNIQNKYGKTVGMYLLQYGLDVPEQWYQDPSKKDNDGLTYAMHIAKSGQIPGEYWKHDPYLLDDDDKTVFELCVENDQQPPEWSYLKQDWRNEDGQTQAMMLAEKGLEIPKQLYHDPLIRDNYGYTIALYQASAGKVPDKQWYHDKFLRCRYNDAYFTVKNILEEQRICVPEEWQYKSLDYEDNNQAMLDAENGIIPKLGNNDPEYQNIYGYTVAYNLVKHNIVPPKEWAANPLIKYDDQYTIAMLLAKKDQIYRAIISITRQQKIIWAKQLQ